MSKFIPTSDQGSLKSPWWEHETGSDDAATSVHNMMRYWDTTQAGLQSTNLRNLRLYSNRETQSLNIAQYVLSQNQDSTFGGNPGSMSGSKTNRISLNVCKSCVDTITNKLVKNKVVPKFLTTGGTLNQRTKAEEMNQFLFGLLLKTKAHSAFKLALRDACIFGTGFVKPYVKGGEIFFDRIFPDEIFVDPADAYYGNPLTEYQRKFISKDVLCADYPERKEDISVLRTIDYPFNGSVTDNIMVVESWRLPKVKGITGRHIICADGVNLVDEPWTRPRSPIRKLHFTSPVLGFFGQGVCEELVGIQIEINRLLTHVQECMRLLQQPRIFMPMGNKSNPNHWVNDIGTFIPYSGEPPTIYTAQTVHPEVFQQLENLWKKAYEIVGVSAMSAQSKKQPGLDAAVAIREMADIESERFMLLSQDYEDFIVDCSLSITEQMPANYKVRAQTDQGLKKLVWKDIAVEQDEYTIKVFPVSALPQHPSARLSYVTELKNSGLIDQETSVELLNFPDLERQFAQQLAPRRLIERTLEKMLANGEYSSPEPYMSLDQAILIAKQMFNFAKLEDYPEERQDMIRQWIDECSALIELGRQSQQQAQEPVNPAQAMQQAQIQQGAPQAGLNPQLALPQMQ
jgi:hypothetical protein